MIDPRDEALQRACPVLAAPLFGVLPAMENGQRVIVASNGVFVQVKRDWLDCVERMGGIDAALPLPYGKITPSIRFTFGTIPIALLDAFIAAGRAGLPNEIAGGLIYSAQRHTLRLAIYEAVRSTAHGIEYRMPPLARDESIAVDLHTHGLLPRSGPPRTTGTTARSRSRACSAIWIGKSRARPSGWCSTGCTGRWRTRGKRRRKGLRPMRSGPHSMHWVSR